MSRRGIGIPQGVFLAVVVGLIIARLPNYLTCVVYAARLLTMGVSGYFGGFC